MQSQQLTKSLTHKSYLDAGTAIPFTLPNDCGALSTGHIWEITKPHKETASSNRHNKKWICKWVGETNKENIIQAESEVIAQEWIRFFMPWHPKTRYWIRNNDIYILSEKISNFRSFRNILTETESSFIQMIEASLEDLAETLIICAWLDEDDLHCQNIGFNAQNKIVKLDGGLCFASLFLHSRHHDITQADLSNFISLTNYSPHHWLFKNEENYIDISKYANYPRFQHGLNRGLAKIITLPNTFIQCFIDAYRDDIKLPSVRVMSLIKRKQMLARIVSDFDSFQEYYQSDLRINDLDNYHEQIKTFKTMSHFVLWDQTPNIVSFRSARAIKK